MATGYDRSIDRSIDPLPPPLVPNADFSDTKIADKDCLATTQTKVVFPRKPGACGFPDTSIHDRNPSAVTREVQ
jgi:hypothetical protein